MDTKKHIAILGSTGSIGTQALEVISAHADLFEVETLTAYNNADLLIQQAYKFVPNQVVIVNEERYEYVKEALANYPIKVYTGFKSLLEVVSMPSVDVVLAAMVGYAGLAPTVAAIKAGKTIALANKETLVVAGELITRLALQHKVNIYPVDSEHSAIFQCLAGEMHNPVEKIILTASGGPFRGWSRERLKNVTPGDALKHPNWCMGNKITIDSATLMNKGFEAIEAKWLFNLEPSQIEVLVHPQSIIHSMVQFSDGSIKAQLGVPDMRLPIQYALSYPYRLESNFPRLNFSECTQFTFEKPDTSVFRNLAFAFHAMERGGNIPCALNAANEVVVHAFLCEQIGFLEMSDIIEKTLTKASYCECNSLEDYEETDRWARNYASSLI
ncbi:MAG TPA: 1-deoxy-D-xylulose-5-phosphate reductoisomerase [Bacteroidales bacterium]|nr:1-deoxy-D-xylulose-5-phosphate reductoisomerase [Bacteroidales bacterium]HPO66306.1 1-deoxy-D-xylulose-5-phosphate reductoisomerase [Bacteroidales bacterium]